MGEYKEKLTSGGELIVRQSDCISATILHDWI